MLTNTHNIIADLNLKRIKDIVCCNVYCIMKWIIGSTTNERIILIVADTIFELRLVSLVLITEVIHYICSPLKPLILI